MSPTKFVSIPQNYNFSPTDHAWLLKFSKICRTHACIFSNKPSNPNFDKTLDDEKIIWKNIWENENVFIQKNINKTSR